MSTDESRLFPALLKHWRGCRGLSQLDLALSADVSSRHVSFLETGRAKPSREMVLRLGTTLDVPLREQNEMLRAAGFGAEFDEPSLADGFPPAISGAIERMMAKHEPFPMVVLDHHYDIVRSNHSATRLLAAIVPAANISERPNNVFHLLFDPALARGAVADWETTARVMVSRLHRESLARPGNVALHELVESLFQYPDVPEEWRQPDFSQPSDPVLALRFRFGDLQLSFLTTVTVFDAPQNITMQELRIESYFPLDDATAAACESLST